MSVTHFTNFEAAERNFGGLFSQGYQSTLKPFDLPSET